MPIVVAKVTPMSEVDDLDRQARTALNTLKYDEASKPLEKLRQIDPEYSEQIVGQYIRNNFQNLPGKYIEELADKHLPAQSHERKLTMQGLGKYVDNYSNSDTAKSYSGNLLRQILPHVGEYTAKSVIQHPNFQITDQEKNHAIAGEFWHNFERQVQPYHFAAIKSLQTGQPERIVDHRNRLGHSDFALQHLPHLNAYAQAMQEQVKNDPFIPKRYFGGVPHVQVYRGVGGAYANKLREHFNLSNGAVDNKTFTLPTAPMSSWSTQEHIAQSFADTSKKKEGGMYGEPNKGIVLRKWMPLTHLIHSGFHDVTPGQEHAHTEEREFVFKHPEGKIRLNSSHVYQHEAPVMGMTYLGGDLSKPVAIETGSEFHQTTVRPKAPKNDLNKSEPDFNQELAHYEPLNVSEADMWEDAMRGRAV